MHVRGRPMVAPTKILKTKNYLLAISIATATTTVILSLGVVTCADECLKSIIVHSFAIAPNQIVKCNVAIIGKLYCRPQKKLSLSAIANALLISRICTARGRYGPHSPKLCSCPHADKAKQSATSNAVKIIIESFFIIKPPLDLLINYITVKYQCNA